MGNHVQSTKNLGIACGNCPLQIPAQNFLWGSGQATVVAILEDSRSTSSQQQTPKSSSFFILIAPQNRNIFFYRGDWLCKLNLSTCSPQVLLQSLAFVASDIILIPFSDLCWAKISSLNFLDTYSNLAVNKPLCDALYLSIPSTLDATNETLDQLCQVCLGQHLICKCFLLWAIPFRGLNNFETAKVFCCVSLPLNPLLHTCW